MRRLLPASFLLPLLTACLSARDYKEISALREQALTLSSRQVEDLEKRLMQKPKDEEARIKLLFYYASSPPGADLSRVKIARIPHILWVIDHDPKGGLGLMGDTLGIPCDGGPIADSDGYREVAEAWVRKADDHSSDPATRRQAVEVTKFCDPEKAERLLRDVDDQAGLASLYVQAVLGMTGASKKSGLPRTSSERRQGSFAVKARQKLEEGDGKDFVIRGATSLLTQGAELWAEGQLDWDYTTLGKSLYERAIRLDAEDFGLATVTLVLPERGAPPPGTLRVGGNVQAQNLLRKVTPPYPAIAKANGINGTVRMTALLGLDGAVLRLKVERGPQELIPAAFDAVRQWVYKPTLLNGKPVYIITLIDVNFTLQ